MTGLMFKNLVLGAILASASISSAQKPDSGLVKNNLAGNNSLDWDTSGGFHGDEPWTFFDDGALEATVPPEEDTFAMAMLDTNFPNVDYNVTITADDYSDNDAVAIFRASSTAGGDFYWARLREDKVQLGLTIAPGRVKRQEEDWGEVIAEGEGQFEGGESYPLRIMAGESNIDVFVMDMDKPVVSHEVAGGGSAGCLGVAVYSGTAMFSEVSFSAL